MEPDCTLGDLNCGVIELMNPSMIHDWEGRAGGGCGGESTRRRTESLISVSDGGNLRRNLPYNFQGYSVHYCR